MMGVFFFSLPLSFSPATTTYDSLSTEGLLPYGPSRFRRLLLLLPADKRASFNGEA